MYVIVQLYDNPETSGGWEKEVVAICPRREIAQQWAKDNAPTRKGAYLVVTEEVPVLNADAIDARSSLKGFPLEKFLRCRACFDPA